MITINLLKPKWAGRYVECDAEDMAGNKTKLYAFRTRDIYKFQFGRYCIYQIIDYCHPGYTGMINPQI